MPQTHGGLQGSLSDAVADLEAVQGVDALASASRPDSQGSLREHIRRVGVARQLQRAVSLGIPGLQADARA